MNRTCLEEKNEKEYEMLRKRIEEMLKYYDEQLETTNTETLRLYKQCCTLLSEEQKHWDEIRDAERKIRDLVMDREMYLLLRRQLLVVYPEGNRK